MSFLVAERVREDGVPIARQQRERVAGMLLSPLEIGEPLSVARVGGTILRTTPIKRILVPSDGGVIYVETGNSTYRLDFRVSRKALEEADARIASARPATGGTNA